MTNAAPNIALMAGSNRNTSINKQLVHAVARKFQLHGAKTQIIEITDYDMPMFCADDDMPANAIKLAREMTDFDGIFIATPEYNGAPPAVLKNLIDWISMVGTDHFTLPIYAVGAATPGPMSGIMAMRQLNYILGRLGCNLVPVQVGTGNAKTAFDKNGDFIDGVSNDLASAMVEQMLARIHERALLKFRNIKAS
ncbi:MAG: hypothetical protein COA43_08135 [Robiginitomaculum sp.]|nr:MAG: hypothetical protein COA43_08135 [Robiginitomaculum sp.]